MMILRALALGAAAALAMAGGAAAQGKPDVRLYAIDCGKFDLPDADTFADDGAYKGVPKKLVVPCYLIRHPKGDLVWDTGLPVPATPPPGAAKPLVDSLKELGLAPKDIEYLSVSHSHFDHIGQAGVFAGSTWIVHEREKEYAFRPQARANASQFGAYSALEGAKTVEIKGEAPHDVFGDGSVMVIPAPGHTPGHTLLLVKLRQAGNVLLTGDLWHIAESRAAKRVPRFNFNREQTLKSYALAEQIAAKEKARVVRQHVPEDFAAMPKFPQALR
ncbi:N-acyl homoserine lactonase family protein [Phenylobacterium sp.]|jgi:glyoxylase-like metal-dependent hydrolase (beta-lactamase superfamily II)|uniref:N-acyl homoserine lactonase family protein n=1 Tax=Phenylobacterium sp. TaxID=1871053 RepID=UPI002F95700F